LLVVTRPDGRSSVVPHGHGDRADVLGQQSGVRDSGETQRAPEGTTPLRQREAGRIRVQMRSPARQSAVQIRQEPEIISGTGRDEPNQLKSRRTFAAANAGAGNDPPDH
jgi:hypothetical protein